MLSGTPPFYEENNMKLFERIKACDYSFDSTSWTAVSEEAMDFVKQLLVREPKNRLDCE